MMELETPLFHYDTEYLFRTAKMKRKKGAFDIEDIFAYLLFVAMVIFFLILLKIRTAGGLPILGKSADKEVLSSNSIAILEAHQGLNFMQFLKQTVELDGEQMTMSELLSRYYYGDKFMHVSDDIKKAQKEKVMEKINEVYSNRCVYIFLEDKGDGPDIALEGKKCADCPIKLGGSFPSFINEDDYITKFSAAIPSEYGSGLNWLMVGIKDVKIKCGK